jgi:hypothetical protein
MIKLKNTIKMSVFNIKIITIHLLDVEKYSKNNKRFNEPSGVNPI